jgi:hypothetical protein
MSNELKNIISGTLSVTGGGAIQTALNYLRASKKTGRTIEKSEFFDKKIEVEFLSQFAKNTNTFFTNLSGFEYLSEGAEQKVYWYNDGKNVIKTNDTIFYETWEDYLVSLLIHNYLFPKTAYELIGFLDESNCFYAIVKQLFITSTEPTNLEKLKEFLLNIGFLHKKNNDFYHPELGIILEDLHDENVLTNNGVFFIIDSAIYLIEKPTS